MTETYRIRSEETWARARDDYRSGLTAEAVCRRHDLGLSAFRQRARREGWRRVDQPDPAPDDLDLTIYDDVEADEQVEMARLRFVQALERGQAVEAMRWRRLWRTMWTEQREFDRDFFKDMTPEEIGDFFRDDPATRNEKAYPTLPA